MKRTFLIFLCIISCFFGQATAYAEPLDTQAAPSAAPDINAEAAILIDSQTGEILYEKNSKQRMYPASITKLMTILLALENGSLSDTITFSHDAVYSIETGSAHISMQEGETLTLEQAIYAIILRSANEVSNAVAEHVDGTVTAFAQHMTERAKELGCEETNFVNANGLFHENHYTTAYDMSLIAKELLTHDEYRQIMSNTYYEIPPTELQSETRYLHGQHQMLNQNSIYYYEYATGGKTGYVEESLNTLVTYAKKDDTELIAVVLKCSGADHYTDTKALFEYGFQNYHTVKLFSTEDYTRQVTVTENYNNETTTLTTISVSPDKDHYQTLPIGVSADSITVEENIPESVAAPVEAGQEIGTLTILRGTENIGTISLLAQTSVQESTSEEIAVRQREEFIAFIKKIGIALLCAFITIALVFCITRSVGYYRRKKRKKERLARQRRHARRRQRRQERKR